MKKNLKKFNNNVGLSARRIAIEILLEVLDKSTPWMMYLINIFSLGHIFLKWNLKIALFVG